MTDLQRAFAGYSITAATVRYADLAYLVTSNDQVIADGYVGSLIFDLDAGTWAAGALKWLACSSTVCHAPQERFVVLGVQGQVNVAGGGEVKEERPIAASAGVDPARRGPLREVRGIARGRAFAVGTARQAYVRVAPDEWRCIDATAQTPGVNLADKSFESVDGFAESDVFTVGWDGEIWHYDGERFVPEASPTTAALYRVRCAPDGIVYACGQSGTLLRRQAGTWSVVAQTTTRDDFFGLEVFEGAVYVASLRAVYRLSGDALVPVDFGDDVPSTCGHLSAADGILWCAGAKDVVEFDGSSFKRVVAIRS